MCAGIGEREGTTSIIQVLMYVVGWAAGRASGLQKAEWY